MNMNRKESQADGARRNLAEFSFGIINRGSGNRKVVRENVGGLYPPSRIKNTQFTLMQKHDRESEAQPTLSPRF